jgi:hypothetical protein
MGVGQDGKVPGGIEQGNLLVVPRQAILGSDSTTEPFVPALGKAKFFAVLFFFPAEPGEEQGFIFG